jgi:hypothetical protein
MCQASYGGRKVFSPARSWKETLEVSEAYMKFNKLFWAGAIVVAMSVAPLLLYVIFGPKDGNPIGLGLLMFFGVPLGLVLLVIGLVTGRR